VQNIQGKGTFVMDKGNELMKRQLETRVRTSLAEACNAAHAADLALDELSRMLEEEYQHK
jgi:GntR family transcriptional regulator